MSNKPAHQQRVVPSSEVLFQEVGGETVLLNLSNESYFGLDPVGTRVWQLLVKNPDLAAAFQTMLDEFEVDADKLENDLLMLVKRLAHAGLVTVD